jgi:hypothetical protein
LQRRPTTKLNIGCRHGECTVDFEPLGNVLTVKEDDFLIVEFPDGLPAQVDITYTGYGISIWPDNDWVRVTNKAGEVLIPGPLR